MIGKFTFFLIFFILFNNNSILAKEVIVDEKVVNRINMECAKAYPKKILIQYMAHDRLENEKGVFGYSNLSKLSVCFKDFLKPGLKFVDLGCGDGRVVFLASLYDVKAYGIEWDERLYKVCLNARKRLKEIISHKKITFIKGDFFEYDFSQYDILYLNPATKEFQRLIKKLYEEAKKESVIIVYSRFKYLEEIENTNKFTIIGEYSKDNSRNLSIKVYKIR